jgi:hypothetical protein
MYEVCDSVLVGYNRSSIVQDVLDQIVKRRGVGGSKDCSTRPVAASVSFSRPLAARRDAEWTFGLAGDFFTTSLRR